MIGIIVTGHNRFSEGMVSSIEMIAGKHDNFEYINFTDDVTPEQLENSLRDTIARLDVGKGVLVFTDLKGGTPYIKASTIKFENDNVEVLSGSNVAMILDALLTRTTDDDLNSFAKKVVNVGKEQVCMFEIEIIQPDNMDDFDGI